MKSKQPSHLRSIVAHIVLIILSFMCLFFFFTIAFSVDVWLDISPVFVAEMYHNRWHIVLFFNWL